MKHLKTFLHTIASALVICLMFIILSIIWVWARVTGDKSDSYL